MPLAGWEAPGSRAAGTPDKERGIGRPATPDVIDSKIRAERICGRGRIEGAGCVVRLTGLGEQSWSAPRGLRVRAWCALAVFHKLPWLSTQWTFTFTFTLGGPSRPDTRPHAPRQRNAVGATDTGFTKKVQLAASSRRRPQPKIAGGAGALDRGPKVCVAAPSAFAGPRPRHLDHRTPHPLLSSPPPRPAPSLRPLPPPPSAGGAAGLPRLTPVAMTVTPLRASSTSQEAQIS